ncbi:MAG: hypothetical protein KBD52_03005 [Candidatus Pacebacteria bacterium]|nr:hypothetical protein [Candidatus Paceibacterota bacterium]
MKTILVDAVDCFIIEKDGEFIIFQDMSNLLETYPNRKIILTGAPDEKIKLYGLDKVPYKYFTLKQNPPKSDGEYYKTMLKNLNLDLDDTIYFEHNPKAVESAQSVGIKTYFYDNDKKDLVSLKKFLDENL